MTMLYVYLHGCAFFLGAIALLSHLHPHEDWQLRQAGWRGLILATMAWPVVVLGVVHAVATRRRAK